MQRASRDFYEIIRERITDWAKTPEGKSHAWVDYLLLLPDLIHLLCSLALDPEVPRSEKARLAVVIAYIFSPMDLIPEALAGPVGFIDDLAISAYALNRILSVVGEETVTKYWKGDRNLLAIIRELMKTAEERLGGKLLTKLKSILEKA